MVCSMQQSRISLADWNARLNTRDGSPANPTDISRGIFGATVGIDRLLKLWSKYDIKTTWFVPAHSLESFPEQLGKVRDCGHEM
jgi:peptidoglycan/xylan/chitin deacetylase (PgdA/CDA1 family)